MKSLLDYHDLMAEVHRLSSENKSGTIFITTTDGHLARLILDEGKISSLVYDRKLRGYDALALIQTIKSGHLQFADGLFETAQEVPLPNTSVLLHYLDEKESIESIVSASNNKFNEAFEIIKKALATHIGPFAIIATEEYIEQIGSITTKDDILSMTNSLALEIDNHEDKQSFKTEVNDKLVTIGII